MNRLDFNRSVVEDAVGDLSIGPLPLDDIRKRAKRVRRVRMVVVGFGALAIIIMLPAGYAALSANQDKNSSVADPGPAYILQAAALVPTAGSIQLEARVGGILAADSRGCVFLASTDGNSRIYVVWPHGTTAVADSNGSFQLRDQSGKIVATGGDAISGSGNYISDGTVQIPAECAGAYVAVAYMNHIGT